MCPGVQGSAPGIYIGHPAKVHTFFVSFNARIVIFGVMTLYSLVGKYKCLGITCQTIYHNPGERKKHTPAKCTWTIRTVNVELKEKASILTKSCILHKICDFWVEKLTGTIFSGRCVHCLGIHPSTFHSIITQKTTISMLLI
jgi:hypothetical protein